MKEPGKVSFFEAQLLSGNVVKYGKFAIFGVLIVVELFLVANNWDATVFGVAAWQVLVPVCVFLVAENAIKFWAVPERIVPMKIVCYVSDFLALLALTVFSDGTLISTLYVVILTEFYLTQKDLRGSIAMGASCLGLFLITFILSNLFAGKTVSIIALASSMLNDFIIIVLHFCIINMTLQIYRKNIEITKAFEELNASNEKLQAANLELQRTTALEERQRIAKDIHDTAGHSITTVIMQTEAARLVIDSDPEEAKQKISAANLQAKHALEELRESVHLLSGSSEQKSLKDALLEIVHDSTDGTGITIRYDIDDVKVCDAKRRFFLHALKEGISNGLRHGQATAFWFEFKSKAEHITFLLSDNGVGQELSEFHEGFGLGGMQKRAAALGGEVWFETEPDEGFELHAVLPQDK